MIGSHAFLDWRIVIVILITLFIVTSSKMNVNK